MRKQKVLKAFCLLFAAISVASFAPPVEAQIDFKLRTEDGGSTLTERYYYNRGDTVLCPRGIFNGCAVSLNSIQIFNWTGEFSGYANVNSGPQTFSISGNLAHNGVDNQNQYGEARANHVSSLYADVLPGMSVKVKFRHSSSITWNIPVNGGYGQATWAFTPYPLTAVGGGVAVNTAVPSDTRSEPATVSAITATARLSSPIIVDGGKTYYFLGTFDTSGYLWMERQAPAGETGSFSSSIDNIAVRHIGKALYYNGGAGQTGRAGQTLPLAASVKVLDETTNSPVTGNVQIAFYITDPNGVETGLGQAWKDYYSGIADKAIPLGLIPGTYTITAICPAYICVEGGRTVTMTAVAKAVELLKISGDGTMPVGRRVLNPLRAQAFHPLLNTGVAGYNVDYTIVSVPPGGEDAAPAAQSVVADRNGNADYFLTLGKTTGEYVVKARCETCLGNKEVLFTVTGAPVPPDEHYGAEGERVGPPPPPETGTALIAFQNSGMRPPVHPHSHFKTITRASSRIGALRYYVRDPLRGIGEYINPEISFKAIVIPQPNPPLNDSDYEWSGASGNQTGQVVSVTYDERGRYSFTQTLTIRRLNLTRTVNVTVRQIDEGPNRVSWSLANPIYAPDVVSCALSAEAYSTSEYGNPDISNVGNAVKHSFWNACIAYTRNSTIAEEATTAYERTSMIDNPENETVMDLENNADGRAIGEQLPPIIGQLQIPGKIEEAARNRTLTILDDPYNRIRAGVLEPSY